MRPFQRRLRVDSVAADSLRDTATRVSLFGGHFDSTGKPADLQKTLPVFGAVLAEAKPSPTHGQLSKSRTALLSESPATLPMLAATESAQERSARPGLRKGTLRRSLGRYETSCESYSRTDLGFFSQPTPDRHHNWKDSSSRRSRSFERSMKPHNGPEHLKLIP